VFTGIIQAMGKVVKRQGSRLVVEAPLAGLKKGDSVAVEGVCLTVVGRSGAGRKRRYEFDVSTETFAKTSLGGLRPSSAVNLEPALRAGQPLGGHFVLGHVDGTGKLVSKTPAGEATVTYEFTVPLRLHHYLASKGSVAVNGVSLTVVDLKEHSFTAAVIPHTEAVTTFGGLRPGDAVNLETDVLAKHVERLLRRAPEGPSAGTDLFIKKDVSWDDLMHEEGYK
jgi:riboflavin synthase alpha subunit